MLQVAPLVGAWIEISSTTITTVLVLVAPLVGAWIEINNSIYKNCSLPVAPLVGAWIEIYEMDASNNIHQSLLSWERGLKWLILLK